MDAALIQPPVWGNLRTPWEICYQKSFLEQNGYNTIALDYSIDALKPLTKFSKEIRKTVGDIFPTEVYLTSPSFLLSVAEYYLIRLFYQEEIDSFEEATKALMELRTVFRGERLIRLTELFLNNSFFNSLDMQLKEKCEKLVDMQPSYVSCTSHTITYPLALNILRIIKSLDPNITTVICGYESTMVAESTYHRCPWIDVVLRGESEKPLLQILRKKPRSRQIISNKDILNIDDTPPPDYTDLELSEYKRISLLGSRNCSYQKCVFCQENQFWSPFRLRNAKKLVDDMELLFERHGNPIFEFVDLGLEKFAAPLAEELERRGHEYVWSGTMRADINTPNVVRRLKKSGCESLCFGIESGSPKILKHMNKGTTPEIIASVLRETKTSGITSNVYCISGLPMETEDDFSMTLGFVEKNRDFIDMAAIQNFKALPDCPIGKDLLDGNGKWGIYHRHAPELSKIENLLCSVNFTGSPSYEDGLRREIHARRKFRELGIDMTYPTTVFSPSTDCESGILGIR